MEMHSHIQKYLEARESKKINPFYWKRLNSRTPLCLLIAVQLHTLTPWRPHINSPHTQRRFSQPTGNFVDSSKHQKRRWRIYEFSSSQFEGVSFCSLSLLVKQVLFNQPEPIFPPFGLKNARCDEEKDKRQHKK
jgi:hypothetical protein